MATYTPNYGLHQWVPEDEFHRTDFNEDFKKIDTQLYQLNEKIETLIGKSNQMHESMACIAYTTYGLAIKHYDTNKASGIRQMLFMDDFTTSEYISTLTGTLRHQGNILLLPRGEPTASMITPVISLPGLSWNRVMAWINHSADGGEYGMLVNGIPMNCRGTWPAYTSNGLTCTQMEVEITAPGSESVVFELTLGTGNNQIAQVYEYGVMFF